MSCLDDFYCRVKVKDYLCSLHKNIKATDFMGPLSHKGRKHLKISLIDVELKIKQIYSPALKLGAKTTHAIVEAPKTLDTKFYDFGRGIKVNIFAAITNDIKWKRNQHTFTVLLKFYSLSLFCIFVFWKSFFFLVKEKEILIKMNSDLQQKISEILLERYWKNGK